MGCHSLLQGVFLTQGLNPGLLHWASLVTQSVKNLPAVQETWVQFLGQEDPLEKGMARSFPVCGLFAKNWSFSFSTCPSSEYSGLISVRTDWFDLLAVLGTLKSLFSSITIQKHQVFSA